MTIRPNQLGPGLVAYLAATAPGVTAPATPFTIAADSVTVTMPAGTLTAAEANATTGNGAEAIRAVLETIYASLQGVPAGSNDAAKFNWVKSITPKSSTEEFVSYRFDFVVDRGSGSDFLGKDTE